jgi:hypothetical protein
MVIWANRISKSINQRKVLFMPYHMWINGTYTPGTSNKVIEVGNSATEDIIDTPIWWYPYGKK